MSNKEKQHDKCMAMIPRNQNNRPDTNKTQKQPYRACK